jgi:MFS family permease
MPTTMTENKLRVYNRILLSVAGLGGLLYGIDVGIIGGALPYLEATSHLTPGQLSIIVAAVLLGSVFSTLFAGLLADWMGRKPLMIVSGTAFVLSIPVIALSGGYESLFMGRLLQGCSAGLVGIVVPLYLAECLPASQRGRGTAVFQWLLTLGIFVAALIGIYYSYHVAEIERTMPQILNEVKDHAWRRIFWMSMPPGLLFVLGGFFVSESPRWLFSKGRKPAALEALRRSRTESQATVEIGEMEQVARETAGKGEARGKRESLLQRRYILPFLLACVILSCNTATGINSVIGFNTNILLQSGLADVSAHWGYVVFTFCNFAFTIVGMTLVDRKGRKFLFTIGTAGIIVAHVCTAVMFIRSEAHRYDARDALQAAVSADQSLSFQYDDAAAQRLIPAGEFAGERTSLAVIYSYGDFTGTTLPVRTGEASPVPVQIRRSEGVPAGKVQAFFSNPFANLEGAQTAPLTIEHAYISPVPSTSSGWLMAIFLYMFVAFYACGPGVCVWLALSELMPTRIRSNGMSIALVINQLVSTTLAAIFLPMVGKYGYSRMFFLFAGFTVVYLLTVAFFLPETKGKTLEEIEKHFEGV